MNSNKKDKEIILLVIIGAVALVYAFYAYLLSPLMTSANDMKLQLDNEDTMLRNMYSTVLSHDSLIDELSDKTDKAEKDMSELFIKTHNEDYIEMIREMLVSSKLKFKMFSSEAEAAFIDVVSESELPALNETPVNIEATGTYDQVYSFFKLLNQSEKLTVCESFEIDNGKADQESLPLLSGNENKFLGPDELGFRLNIRFISVADASAIDSLEFEKNQTANLIVPQDFLDGSYRKLKGLFN